MRPWLLRLLLLCCAAATPALATQGPYGCSAHVVVPDGTTSIPPNAYYPTECDLMTSLTIPDSVKIIGMFAFHGNPGRPSQKPLVTVDLGKGVNEINQQAFADTGITSITIPDSVETIGWGAFYSCRHLATVLIGAGVIRIGKMAFMDTALSGTVVIPAATQYSTGEHASFPPAVTVLKRVRPPQHIPQHTGPPAHHSQHPAY